MTILILFFFAVLMIFVFLLSEAGIRTFILMKRFVFRLPPPRISVEEAQEIAIEEAIQRGIALPNFRTTMQAARAAGYGVKPLDVYENTDRWHVVRRHHGVDFEATVDNQDGHIIFFYTPLPPSYDYYEAGLGCKRRKSRSTSGQSWAGSGQK